MDDFRPDLPHERRFPVEPSPQMMDTAIAEERARREAEGFPTPLSDEDLRESIERWLDPEVISRAIVRDALWEMHRHDWAPKGFCSCGEELGLDDRFEAMRRHHEDILAAMLGLTIKPDEEQEDE